MLHSKSLLTGALALTFATSVPSFADMHVYTLGTSRTKDFTDGKLHIYFCGTGDPEVGMQNIRKPSCLAVVADNQFFLIDAGEGAAQNLGAIGLPMGKIEHIFMTHWHSDHFAGLGYVNNVSWLGGRKKPLTVYGPFGVQKIVEALNNLYELDVLYRATNRQNLLDPNYSQIEPSLVNVTDAEKPVYKTENFELTPFKVNHEPAFPALGYMIKFKGCKVVVSGDTNIQADLDSFYKDADVLINEAFSHNLGQMIQNSFKGASDEALEMEFYKQTAQYHSDTLEIAKSATKNKVKQVVLTHLVPSIPTTSEAKDSFTKGMDELYKGKITVADDRDELVVEESGGKCIVTYIPAAKPTVTQKITSQ